MARAQWRPHAYQTKGYFTVSREGAPCRSSSVLLPSRPLPLRRPESKEVPKAMEGAASWGRSGTERKRAISGLELGLPDWARYRGASAHHPMPTASDRGSPVADLAHRVVEPSIAGTWPRVLKRTQGSSVKCRLTDGQYDGQSEGKWRWRRRRLLSAESWTSATRRRAILVGTSEKTAHRRLSSAAGQQVPGGHSLLEDCRETS